MNSLKFMTNEGFKFLLKSNKEQLWILIVYSIKYLKKLDLIFLLMEIISKKKRIMKYNIKLINNDIINRWLLFLDFLGIVYLESIRSIDNNANWNVILKMNLIKRN